MTVTELERKAWWLIALAKIATNKTRRKELMQEAFDLATRASTLRQLEFYNEELNGRSSIGDQGYGMRLSNSDGRTLWVYLTPRAGPTRCGLPMPWGARAQTTSRISTCGMPRTSC